MGGFQYTRRRKRIAYNDEDAILRNGQPVPLENALQELSDRIPTLPPPYELTCDKLKQHFAAEIPAASVRGYAAFDQAGACGVANPDFVFLQSATQYIGSASPINNIQYNAVETITFTLDKPKSVFVSIHLRNDIDINEAVVIVATIEVDGVLYDNHPADYFVTAQQMASLNTFYGEAIATISGFVSLSAGVHTIKLMGRKFADIGAGVGITSYLSIGYIV